MSSLPLLRRRRERRLSERQRAQNRLTRSFVSLGLVLAVVAGGLLVGAALTYAYLTADLPALELLPALLEPPNGALLQPTRIYDRTGEHLLAVLATQDAARNYVPLDPHAANHLPNVLANATLALADPDFYTHPGYTLEGLTQPDVHPTLAQALVANLLLWDEPAGLRRAIRERLLAAQLTTHYGRQKILEWYLNSANYGHFAYGADTAARLYFSKPAAQLNLAEAALLAAVSQAPAINPLDAPQAAIQRQQATLYVMLAHDLITEQELNLARFVALNFQPTPPQNDPAPAFTALALAQLDSRVDRTRIERGGMRVITSLDYGVQLQATCAVKTQLARLSGQNNIDCEGGEALPALPPGLHALDGSASAVVIDPRAGQVLAFVGDTKQGQESAFLTGRRPGSLLTPFVYLAGFTRGLGPASLVWDIPSSAAIIPNPDGQFHGPIRLRTALARDYLAPAEQVFAQMGAPLVQQTLRPFGFDLSAVTLGALLKTETRYSLLEVASAYGILAAQGTRVGAAPLAVLRVESTDGRSYFDFNAPQSAQVVSPQLAYLVTDILRAEASLPSALKTGQTPDGQEAWAVSYTPQRVAIVWLGTERATEAQPGSGFVLPAAGLGKTLLQFASREVPATDWVQPAGVVRLRVCDPSGMLPTSACPNQVDELFLDGYQPAQADTLYQAYAVNRETGFLATVFTPPQLIENRVYMVVPPEAQAWAKTASLPVPPTQYDTIQTPPVDENAHITAPGMFAELKGQVTITGAASGTDFGYYRLQYGQGLNPQTWVQIGAESQAPVTEGALAEWDTSGLDGLYALQLLVVHKDNSLQIATVQVLINNSK
jgi:membrane peptidoglycan carboxypeptidase